MDRAGLVLQVHNTSDKSLSCKLIAHSEIANQTLSHIFSVGPNSTEEIGLVETNWTFKTGERVQIEVEGYSSKGFSVP